MADMFDIEKKAYDYICSLLVQDNIIIVDNESGTHLQYEVYCKNDGVVYSMFTINLCDEEHIDDNPSLPACYLECHFFDTLQKDVFVKIPIYNELYSKLREKIVAHGVVSGISNVSGVCHEVINIFSIMINECTEQVIEDMSSSDIRVSLSVNSKTFQVFGRDNETEYLLYVLILDNGVVDTNTNDSFVLKYHPQGIIYPLLEVALASNMSHILREKIDNLLFNGIISDIQSGYVYIDNENSNGFSNLSVLIRSNNIDDDTYLVFQRNSTIEDDIVGYIYVYPTYMDINGEYLHRIRLTIGMSKIFMMEISKISFKK